MTLAEQYKARYDAARPDTAERDSVLTDAYNESIYSEETLGGTHIYYRFDDGSGWDAIRGSCGIHPWECLQSVES